MPHLIAGTDRDNIVREVVVSEEGNLINLEYIQDYVHQGRIWTVNMREKSNANNGIIWLRIRTGTKQLHLVINFTNGGDGYFDTWAASTNYATDGTAPDGIKCSVFNRNGVVRVPLLSTVTFNPTFTVANTPNGTQRGLRGIQGGTGGNSTGGAERGGIESVIRPNSDFLCAVTNVSGQTKMSTMDIEMYEE